MIKSAILSTRVFPEFFAEADRVARDTGKKRGDFIEEAVREKIERVKNPIPIYVGLDMNLGNLEALREAANRPGAITEVPCKCQGHGHACKCQDLRIIPETDGKHREMILAALKKGPATKFELAAMFGWQEHWASPRLTGLKKDKLIVADGRRVNPQSGKMCAVWRAL